MSKPVLTVAAPEADRDDATHLGVILGWVNGWTPEEWWRAFTAVYLRDGQQYRVMSMRVSADFVAEAAAMTTVQRPPQDTGPPYRVNLTGAQRARDNLVVWQAGSEDADGNPIPAPQASPDRIVAIVGLPGPLALTAMGLEPPPLEI